VSQIKLTHSQLSSVKDYCKLNNIEDVDKFITKCYTEGFNIKKYGLLGDDSGKTDIVGEKQVEIEVIREIRVEVPVEKIVEVIKEVVKYVEVPVPNIDKIGDENKINELLLKIQQLENQEPIIKEVMVEVPVTNLDNICDKPEPIIVEKIVEVIKEVPVETIVERIVEVEKPNDKTLLLQETLQKLRKELSLKNTRIEDLENINKQLESIKVSKGAVYMKGSNINETM
jgi:hypothetical protein